MKTQQLTRLIFPLVFLVAGNQSYAQFNTTRQPLKAVHVETSSHEVFTSQVTMMDGVMQEELKEGDVVEEETRERIDYLCFPLESDTLIVTSPYGYRKDPITGKRKFHQGVDLACASENVYAMMPGRIRKIGYDKTLGNYIEIDHGDLSVIYGHLYTVIGNKGDHLEAGQSIGISGSTGRSTGEHLHVAMKWKKKRMDPLPILEYVKEGDRN